MSAARETAVRRKPTTRGQATTSPVLQVVVAPKRRTGYLVHLAVCVTMLVGALVAVLALNTALTQGSFQIHQLKQELENLEAKENRIAEQLDDLASPEQLAVKAAELGMLAPPSTRYITIKDGTITPAQPAPVEEVGDQ
ncbi:MAG: hypothetical protein FWD29_01995 [Micrococcales bacterium]|nr:hypothetical protein [Micrococcales bacterium]